VACSFNSNAGSGVAVATPNIVSFAAGTVDLYKEFVLSGQEGCYQLTLSGTLKSSYNNATTFVNLFSDTTILVPAVLEARLNNNGGGIFIKFDLDTSKPYQVAQSSCPCNQLLSFFYVDQSSCNWINSAVLYVSLGRNPTILPGKQITILGNKITSQCLSSISICSTYPKLAATTVLLSAPISPAIPALSLVSQTLSVYCDDLFLDATGSTGNGGRGWSSIRWSVNGSLSETNLAILTSYMNSNFPDISAVIIVPNSALFLQYLPTSLTFTLRATNYLGVQGAVSSTITFQYSSLLVPRLFIAGPAIVQTTTSSALTLFYLPTRLI
jgi:hypothetical protein